MDMDRDIDRVIAALRRSFPDIACEQLSVSHPGADDDGIWFITHPARQAEVQLESSTGQLPFVVECSDSPRRDTAHTLDEVVALVTARLGLGAPRN
jgi:hypothetical protein